MRTTNIHTIMPNSIFNILCNQMNWIQHYWYIPKLIILAVKHWGNQVSLSSDWSIPAHSTHTTHTHLWVSISLNFCVFPRFDLIFFFLWAILSAFRPLSLSEQVKNKDPLKIATKVTPPFIHLSLSVPPSSLLLTPSSPSTQRQEGGVQSIPLSLFLL